MPGGIGNHNPRNTIAKRLGSGHIDADIVPLDKITRSVTARNRDTMVSVGRDDVASIGRRASNDVLRRVLNQHSNPAVAKGGRAGGVGADVVALDRVAGAARQVDSVTMIAGDDVSSTVRRAAKQHVGGVVDEHAGTVGQCTHAVGRGADVVALDDIAVRPGKEEETDIPVTVSVAGDDITGLGSSAADRAAGTAVDGDSVAQVCQGCITRRIRADEVPLNHGPRCITV